jgi:hypothetical protein
MTHIPKPSPQPWKMQLELDLFEEFELGEEDTQEIFIDDPEGYMDELELEEDITKAK